MGGFHLETETLPITESSDFTVRKGISGGALKLIAIFTMLIDHIGAAIFETTLIPAAYKAGGNYQLYTQIDIVLRCIGRLAFPIFCFLIVEGFFHTRNVKKYALRLAVFAIISEVPFDLAFFHKTFYWGYQSVYLTLVIGLLVITGIDYVENKDLKRIIKSIIQVLVAALGIALAFALRTDYYGLGVLLILLFYLFRKKELWRNITCCLNLILLGPIELFGVISLIPIHFYNGKKGLKINKYVFYAFYPVHLFILYLIATYLV